MRPPLLPALTLAVLIVAIAALNIVAAWGQEPRITVVRIKQTSIEEQVRAYGIEMLKRAFEQQERK